MTISSAELADLGDVDDREYPCPECFEGEVVSAGPMEHDTGHYPVRCSVRCGWWS